MLARLAGGGLLAGLLGGLLGSSPVAADPGAALRPGVAVDGVTFLDEADLDSLAEALRHSLAWLDRQPVARRHAFGPRWVTVSEQRGRLRRLLGFLAGHPPPELLEARILAEFEPLRSPGRADGTVLVTGYHEPVIDAAELPSPRYPVPVYGVPEDPAALGWPRALFEAWGPGSRGRVLAWARDPVDVFFMEIEGSGTLRLPDGRLVRVGHAATNRRPYRSIGRLLVDEGKLSEESMSMLAIREWLERNPGERDRVLGHNESVVFFRRLPGPPVGSLGVPVTAGRSIATDPRLFPPGALAFVRTERPHREPDGRVVWRSVHRFVLNQDRGGAIRGPGRVDLFWGRGPEADLAAALMKERGDLYFLAPRALPALESRP